ncbi:uncharacterized protein BYT42DRAFT_561888 [Radiomyces spectabilis]|uniref:uncharacterized protein n=1 Tax=Radiomyces spectabilis TaxID=64574 RepID=UPI00221F09DF|nr:uncharacterized protein BYT42DRAFT_561888 [Radiomyces spectabilis]KAI8384253.1 hypothetical protein BYT42DRAFT_561888 [Radiomyces spectabilis]
MLKEDVTLEFQIDPSFTGILRGAAHDESEGCTLKGNCVVNVVRPIKVRRLIVWFEGRCKVQLKAAGYSVHPTEHTDRRTLYTKDQHFIGHDAEIQSLEPGRYLYPFQFEIPSHLPASFRGKRGYIRYRLSAGMYRPMFANDITISKDITIKRCLLNDLAPASDILETAHGQDHPQWIQYSATAPCIAYREGGLIRLNLTMLLLRPELMSVRSVTCALRERVQYRTTDQQAHTLIAKTDDLFPLGYSTFYPSQDENYNPAEKHNYNAVFRLIPRVNADTNSRLLRVTHTLVVNIMLEDKHHPHESGDESASERESDVESEDEKASIQMSPFSTPPPSQPNSPPISRASSSSSLSSLFSLTRNTHGDAGKDGISNLKQHALRRKKIRSGLTMCSLELPLVVTSREHFWDSGMPSPPSYETGDFPPTYGQTIEQLPRVPHYLNEEASAS